MNDLFCLHISPVWLRHHHYPTDLHLLHINSAVCHLWGEDAEGGTEDECWWRARGAGGGPGGDKEKRWGGKSFVTDVCPQVSLFITPPEYLKHLIWPLIGWFPLLPQLQRYKMANGAPDVETGSTANLLPQRKWHSVISPIFVQALTLTFLAEWGDRSQLATIVLAAREVLYTIRL